jgi:hypothetical protein
VGGTDWGQEIEGEQPGKTCKDYREQNGFDRIAGRRASLHRPGTFLESRAATCQSIDELTERCA